MDLRLFTTLLLVVLIALKLQGTIDWSWWLVLFPLWPVLVLVAFAAFSGAVALILVFAEAVQRANRKRRFKAGR